jgi:hypothetical protein
MPESILSRMYRDHRAQQSGSSIYRPVTEQPQKTNIYAGSQQYQGLESYSRQQPDPVDNRSESAKAYTAEHSPWERAAARVAEGVTEADWQAHRDAIQGSGHQVGILGPDEQAARQAALAAQSVRSNSAGGQIGMNGHLALSALTTPGQPALSMLDRLPAKDRPVVVQRAAIPSGSSGQGWTTTR